MIHLIIRGFGDGKLLFEEPVVMKESDMNAMLPMLAEKHIAMVTPHERHMIEVEFLDEPDPQQRFLRFGTDPRGMVMPSKLNLRSSNDN